MTQQEKYSEASLLYMVNKAPLDSVDTVALRSTIEGLGYRVRQVRNQPGEFVILICDEVQILVAGCDTPFSMDHFRGASRPATCLESPATVLSLLARHNSSLTVLVLDRDVQTADKDSDTKELLCRETVDFLLSATTSDLVFWSQTDLLMTTSEAENDLETVPAEKPAPKAEAPQPTPVKKPQVMAEEDTFDLFHNLGLDTAPAGQRGPSLYGMNIFVDAPAEPERPCEMRPNRPGEEPSYHPRSPLGSAPHLSADVMEWFEGKPEVADPSGINDDLAVLRKFLALDEGPEPKRISDTASGRASLYLMSATIAVFALPVGASMLTYNALSGGSFRATSHVMALTGIGLALTSLGLPNPAAALTFAF